MLTKKDINRDKKEIIITESIYESISGEIKSGRNNYFNFNMALVVLLAVTSFFLGMFWTKSNLLEKGTGVSNSAPTNAPIKVANNANAPVAVNADQLKLTKDDHVKGNRNAEILLIEYSDTECPFSKRFHPTAKQAVEEFKDKIALVYRHFPLDQIHSKARKEAEATECAAKLAGNDGFWRMTDKIYEITPSNDGLDIESLPKLASEMGINQNNFKKCLDSGEMAQRVENSLQSGIKAGVQGTPGIFLINTKTNKTKVIPGAVPFDQIRTAMNELL